jgi:hypothetical protein
MFFILVAHQSRALRHLRDALETDHEYDGAILTHAVTDSLLLSWRKVKTSGRKLLNNASLSSDFPCFSIQGPYLGCSLEAGSRRVERRWSSMPWASCAAAMSSKVSW